MLSPRQIFEDNIRPADLLLKVFRLLEHDALNTEEALLRSLRELVKAEADESLLVISNGIFFGTDSRIGRSSTCVDQKKRPMQSAATGRRNGQHCPGDLSADSAKGKPAGSDPAPRTRFRPEERRGFQEPVQRTQIRPR